jgi:predicted nucleic acid-binding protein
MATQSLVCVDSNAMTYLVEAMTNGGCPAGDVAAEKIALLRIYLYRNDILYLSKTVELEYLRIKNETRKLHHKQIADVLLGEIPPVDSSAVETRAAEYLVHHGKQEDCRVLSECELGGGDVLLTYDQDFLKRLRGKTKKIKLYAPSEYWSALGIPQGTRPVTSPHPTNPLSREVWWVW